MPANKTHPTKGIRTGVPTLRLPTVLKLNNNAAGFSLASHGAPNSQRSDGSAPDFSATFATQSSRDVKFDDIRELVSAAHDIGRHDVGPMQPESFRGKGAKYDIRLRSTLHLQTRRNSGQDHRRAARRNRNILSDGRLVRASLQIKGISPSRQKPGSFDIAYSVVTEIVKSPEVPVHAVHETLQ
jgi:hypothetical protein